MSVPNEQMERLRSTRARYEADLMRKANVLGVGIGYRRRGGVTTNEPCLVVLVTRKVAGSSLGTEDAIPDELDGIPVDVQEVGRLEALDVGSDRAGGSDRRRNA